MCRSLASVDNSAVSLGHEHGDQFTCHTDARIRASRPAPRWDGGEFRPGFQWVSKTDLLLLRLDSILVARLARRPPEQLAPFIAQRSSHGSVKLCEMFVPYEFGDRVDI